MCQGYRVNATKGISLNQSAARQRLRLVLFLVCVYVCVVYICIYMFMCGVTRSGRRACGDFYRIHGWSLCVRRNFFMKSLYEFTMDLADP